MTVCPDAVDREVGSPPTPAPTPPLRLAYLVTHPIQYQAPLLRRIAADPTIDLTVFFQSDLSVGSYHDEGFGRTITWDVPLLDGYRHEFLPALGRRDRVDRLRPWSHGIARRLWHGRFDALWVHGYARWFNWSALLAARAAGMAVLVRDEATPLSARRSPLKAMAKRRLVFDTLRAMDARFLAIGSSNRRYYLDNGIAPDRIFLMPYAVDNAYFAARAEAAAPQRERLRAGLGWQPGRPVILFASKFEPRKRAGDLLAAFELLIAAGGCYASPYLLFIGDGDDRPALEARARRWGGDVRFLGFQNQSELPAWFDLCDVFVLPSEAEPWGLIVNEVMSAGRAVVVSDQVGCAPDLVRHGETGYVFPVGDIAALVAALAEVLSAPAATAALGRGAAARMAGWGFAEDLAGLKAALASIERRP